MKSIKPYRRKLSHEDADTGTILITKDRWPAFPAPMQEFPISVGRPGVGGRRFATRIVAEDCACVPPPHQHYLLEAGHFCKLLDFSRGAVIEIEIGDGKYTIRNG